MTILTAAFLVILQADSAPAPSAASGPGAIMELLGYDLERKRPGAVTSYRAQTKLISPRWNSVFFAPARRPRIRHFAAWPARTRTAAMLAATAEAEIRRAVSY